jgi:hypothetical protein
MTQTAQTPPYTLESDDKVAQVMIYTNNALYWGEVVVKELIRVSTWLRTNSAPSRIVLFNAKAMMTGSAPSRPMQFTEVHVATSQILAFHLVPPAKDALDYDPSEPNRRLVPVTMLLGAFRIDGHLRTSTTVSVAKFLELAREEYTSIYEAQVSYPALSSFGVINVPFVLVRQEKTVFTVA